MAEDLAHDALAAAHAADMTSMASRTGGRVRLEHEPFLAQVSLRLDASHSMRAPMPLPLEPNTAWDDGARAALWLGPDEWLLLGPAGTAGDLVAGLRTALDGLHHSIVDVSANRVALVLGGPDRLETLASGCTLDLHARSWHDGMCAQTLFAKAQVVLHERADTTRMLVRPSFAGYVIERMLAGAASTRTASPAG
jgi:sarcosine oxidase subunit gamma